MSKERTNNCKRATKTKLDDEYEKAILWFLIMEYDTQIPKNHHNAEIRLPFLQAF